MKLFKMMDVIYDKLEEISACKKDIKDVITSKGYNVGDNITEYADVIRSMNISSDVPVIPNGTSFRYSDLKFFPSMDTSNVIDMNGMFAHCDKIEVSPIIDTSSVTNMDSMFGECTGLKEVSLMDTSNVMNMDHMVAFCDKLSIFPPLDTSKVTNFDGTWRGCTSLRSLPLLDFSSAEEIGQLTFNAGSLVNFGGFRGLKKSLHLSYTSISEESFKNIIEQADTLTSPQTFYLGDNISKMSEETIAWANSKRWIVSGNRY